MGRGRVGLESRRAPCRVGRAGRPCGSSGGGISSGNARTRLAATRKNAFLCRFPFFSCAELQCAEF
eukprot:4544870-Pyramimonas_sp.AAC.1